MNKPESEIIDVLNRYARGVDQKDWDEVMTCLTDDVYTDYSSFRPNSAGMVSKEELVAERKRSLGELVLTTKFSNFVVDSTRLEALVTCNFEINRFTADRSRYFHSTGQFRFDLVNLHGWKISGMTMMLKENEGDETIHGAFKS